jgi:hypothetical protein
MNNLSLMDTIKEVGDLGMKGKKIPDFYEQFIIDEHNQRSRGSGYEGQKDPRLL